MSSQCSTNIVVLLQSCRSNVDQGKPFCAKYAYDSMGFVVSAP